jgi:tight adherence protein B
MSRHPHIRLLVLALVALAIALPSSASAAPLVVQNVDTSDYPEMSAQVALPPGFAIGPAPAFAVQENGQDVENVQVAGEQGKKSPGRVVLVLDASGSMKGKPLADAKIAAKGFVESLGSDSSVAIVTFSDKPKTISGFTSDREQLVAAIESVEARGGTALYDALVSASSLFMLGGEGRSSIVVLSDGGDTESDASFEKAVAEVKQANTPVYAIALKSKDYNQQALRLLASGTGGRLVPVNSSEKLGGLFAGIAREIKSARTLSWTSDRPRTKDVEVAVVAKRGSEQVEGAFAYSNPDFENVAATGIVMPKVAENAVMLFGVVGLGFIAVTMMMVALLLILVRDKGALDQLHYYDQLHAEAGSSGIGGASDQVRVRVVEAVGVVADKRGMTALVTQKLEAAGMPLRPAEYITAHLLAVIALGVLVQVVSDRLFLSLLTVLLATIVPMLLVENAATKRRMKFEQQLPDVLTMISGSLRGGWGMQQAIALAGKEAPDPAAQELRRVETETRLGIPLERALQSMADRMLSDDFQATVTAIAVQREVGGNLAEVLDIVSKTIRERESMRRQIRALTAEGRLSAWILILLPFFVFVLFMVTNPGYLQPLFTTPMGLAMVATGVVLLVVGSFWMYRVTKIEV